MQTAEETAPAASPAGSPAAGEGAPRDPPAGASPKQRRKEEGRRRAREIAAERRRRREEEDGPAEPRPPRARHGARNQYRHKNFARWLMGTFPQLEREGRRWRNRRRRSGDLGGPGGGIAAVSPPSGGSGGGAAAVGDGGHTAGDPPLHVLDVACGKGELAARLSMCHDLAVVAVDPRPADFAGCYESLVLPRLPKKWQERVSERRRSDPGFVEREVGGRVRQLVRTFDDSSAGGDDELRDAVEGSCLLVGMHADGATEAVVDAALRHRKPFVVVPCCVFPRLFSERFVTEEGGGTSRVRTHEQFCRYLLQKDPRFVMETLPFEGRNVAIWWDGADL